MTKPIILTVDADLGAIADLQSLVPICRRGYTSDRSTVRKAGSSLSRLLKINIPGMFVAISFNPIAVTDTTTGSNKLR